MTRRRHSSRRRHRRRGVESCTAAHDVVHICEKTNTAKPTGIRFVINNNNNNNFVLQTALQGVCYSFRTREKIKDAAASPKNIMRVDFPVKRSSAKVPPPPQYIIIIIIAILNTHTHRTSKTQCVHRYRYGREKIE